MRRAVTLFLVVTLLVGGVAFNAVAETKSESLENADYVPILPPKCSIVSPIILQTIRKVAMELS
jgi:hypothetical protein